MGNSQSIRARYDALTSSVSTLVLMAIGWTVVLLAISPLLGVPWGRAGDFDFRTTMYYHAIMLPLVGILILIASLIMKVGGHVDTLLRYSLVPAIVLCGVGSLFIKDVSDWFPLWMQIIGFLVLDEMAIALLFGLIRMPRRTGQGFRKMNIGYWLVLTTVAAAFIAAVFGHGAGVGIDWGFSSVPGLPGYITSQGIDQSTFTDNLMGSHSHDMLPSVMGGIVGLAMVFFGYDTLKGPRRWLATLGMAVSEFGVLSMTLVFIVAGLTSWGPPTLFQNDPNGLASDDVLMGLVGMGAVIALVGIISMPVERRGKKTVPLAKDPLRLSVVISWLLAFVSVAVFGYFIEFSETYFSSDAGLPHDEAFTSTHLMFGFFMLPIVAGCLLAVDLIYRRTENAPYPQFVAPLALVGEAVMFLGGLVWIMALNSVLFFVGFGVLVFTLLLIAYYLYGIRSMPMSRPSQG